MRQNTLCRGLAVKFLSCLLLALGLPLANLAGQTTVRPNPPALTPQEADLPALETRQIDLRGCIRLHISTAQQVITDEKTMRAAVRNDMRKDDCLRHLKQIDFNTHSLLGITLDTGYCRMPLGLAYRTLKDEAKKRYLLIVSYLTPTGLCRALSQYDLWVRVPKLPAGYEVAFEVRPTPPER